MIETYKKSWEAKVAVLIFGILLFCWVYVNFVHSTDLSKQIFGAIYGLMALWGAITGLLYSREWGGYKSVLGKAMIMFSCGLLAQEFGQIVYSLYTFFFHVEIPYPSLGDLGYFGSIFFYIYGVLLLARASGIKVALKSLHGKFLAVIIPGMLLLISYWIFLRDYPFDITNPLTMILDFGYPLGEAVYIGLALFTYIGSRNLLGGMMRSKILFILFALCIQFAADFSFLFLSRYATIAPGGVNDLIYLSAYFFMSFGLLQFSTVVMKLRQKT